MAHNGGKGIVLDGVASVQLSRNEVTDNGACAIFLDNGANGDVVGPPTVVAKNDLSVEGSVDVSLTISAIEIFDDAGDEAGRYRGTADFDQATGKWAYDAHGGPDDNAYLGPSRVTATVTYTNGETSGLEGLCGDGDGCGGTSCNDADPCTSLTCISGVCGSLTYNTDSPCNDGDPCTHLDLCDAEGACAGTPYDCSLSSTLCKDDEEHDLGLGLVKECHDPVDESHDDDLCTIDTCDPATGECTSEPNPCDDGNGCTEHACDSLVGCTHDVTRPDGFKCEDGNRCTGQGTCEAGRCVFVDTFFDPCPYVEEACGTVGTCDPVAGCTYTTDCNDGYCSQIDMFACGATPADCVDPVLHVVDSDGDALPNIWENDGVDVDCDGTPDLELPNADPNFKNVYVYYDWMLPRSVIPGDRVDDHDPDPDDLKFGNVEQAFLHSPADNGLFGTGVIWTITRGQGIPHFDLIDGNGDATPDGESVLDGDDVLCDASDWATFAELKYDNFPREWFGISHYFISAHGFGSCGGTYSGVGEGNGDSFIIGLDYGEHTVAQYEANEMHEEGHNHGLGHNGGSGPNYETNFQSIMNYAFEGPELIPLCDEVSLACTSVDWPTPVPDYSWEALPELDESALVEADGVQATIPKYQVEWWCPYATQYPAPPVDPGTPGTPIPIDWNCNGTIDAPATVEANISGPKTPDLETLTGAEDWSRLEYSFSLSNGFSDGGSPGLEVGDTEVLDRFTALMEPAFPAPGLLPGCTAQSLGASEYIPVVIYGSAALDVGSFAAPNRWLSGVAPTVSSDDTAYAADVNHDVYDDLVLLFPADAVLAENGVSSPDWLYLAARAEQQWRVARIDFPSGTPVDTSPADGIDDSCDCSVNTTNAHVTCP